MSRLEAEAKSAWKRWGYAWARFTTCTRCGKYLYCRGTRKNMMLCLECFDSNPPKTATKDF